MSHDVRPVTAADASALHEFFAAMPAADRTFFFYDVSDPAVSASWAGDERLLSRAVVDGEGEIVAFAALQPGVDWSSHVADLILAVAPQQRRKGLGRSLAREMLLEALRNDFKKVTVKIAAGDTGAIEMFRKLGFEGEALLRDHLCSPEDGSLRDVVVLAHFADEQWATMMTGGMDKALT